MSKVIDFTEGLDTGEADVDSIQTIDNGEQLDQVTLGRPEQNLRQRTEVLRAEVNENRWIRDANQGMHFWITDGTITFDATLGTLAFSSSFGLFIAPTMNPGETRAAANEGAGALWPSLYHTASFSDGVATNFVIQSKKFDFEGGFDISFTTVDDPGSGAIVVTVTGDASVTNPSTQPGRRDIVVTYDSTDTAYDDWDNIKAAVEGDAIANPLIAITYAAADITAFDTSVELAGGLDTVYHRITEAQMSAFFLASPDNALQEGDTLAIYYDTAQLRRESVEENANNHLIPAGSLANLTREPDKAANAILIGKVIRGSFQFANGYTLWHQQPIGRMEAGHGLGTSLDTSSFVALDNTSTNLQEAWNDLDTVLQGGIAGADTVLRADLNDGMGAPPAPGGGTVGADHVGVEDAGWTSITASQSVTNALDSVDVLLGSGGVLRTDLNNGITVPPAPGAGSAGADHVGINNVGLDIIAPGAETVTSALSDLDFFLNEYTQPLGVYVATPGSDGALRVGVTAADLPALDAGMPNDAVKDALVAINEHLTVYPDLETFLDATSPGAIRQVDNRFANDTEYIDRTQSQSIANNVAVIDLDVDGRYVMTYTDDSPEPQVRIYDRDNLTAIVTNGQIATNEAFTEGYAMRCNGRYVAIAGSDGTTNSWVEVWDYSTLPATHVWTFAETFANRFNDIAWAGDQLIAVDTAGLVRTFDATDTNPPTAVSSYDHTVSVTSVCTNGEHVIFASPTAGALSARIVVLKLLGLFVHGSQAALSTGTPTPRALCCDQNKAYLTSLDVGAAPDTIRLTTFAIRSLDDGFIDDAIVIPAFQEDALITARGVQVDDRYLYINAGNTTVGDAEIRAYEKRTYGCVFQHVWTGTPAFGNPTMLLASDCGKLFSFGHDSANTEQLLYGWRLTGPARRFRHMDEDAKIKPWALLAIPMTEGL
jgi:WD40 repeat protein